MDKRFRKQHFVGYETHAELYLTQGKMALIDLCDLEKCLEHKWCAYNDGYNWYAVTNLHRSNKPKTLHLHKLIANPPKGLEVDHINHNGLDNRRSNLRVCTHAINTANKKKFITNTTGITGVAKRLIFSKRKNKYRTAWVGEMCRNYKTTSKMFCTKAEAIKYRKELERTPCI